MTNIDTPRKGRGGPRANSRVQWRQFRNHSQWTPVHLFDPRSPERAYGGRSALCGKHFNLEDAETGERASGRMCRACQRIAAKQER